MKPAVKFALAIIGLIAFATTTASAQDRPRVVTVNYPLQYFAERLLDDAVEVVFPVPQEVDPSFWRPSISDISQIQSADLIVLNGAGFANWVDRVSLPRSKLVNSAAAIENQFIMTESITHAHGDGGEHSHEGVASYTWLDPTLAIAQATALADAIIARGLSPEDSVAARLDALSADLTASDAAAQTALSALQNGAIIATHPRYQYLARRYDLSISSLEWEAGAMPTAEDLADLRALIEETAARVLIWEAEPPAEAREMAAALGLRNVVFPPLAHAEQDSTFLESFARAVEDLSAAGVN